MESTWSGGRRSSGAVFFCFQALGNTKPKKPTPLDRGPPTPCKQALIVRITVIDFSSNNLGFLENDDLENEDQRPRKGQARKLRPRKRRPRKRRSRKRRPRSLSYYSFEKKY